MSNEAEDMLRPDEKFCIEAIAASVGGRWSKGKDPPDAYLSMGNETIAVEISTLTQHVTDEEGGYRPRLSEDSTAISLCNELDQDLRHDIPANRTVLLILSAPINRSRKLKPKLSVEIMALVRTAGSDDVTVETEIMGNKIIVHLVPEGRPSDKKVVGVVQNDKSSPDILANATAILAERIEAKTKKCKSLRSACPFWLVLFNDYWLADIETYRQAMQKLSVEHSFEKIFIVSGDKSVAILDDRDNKPFRADAAGARG